VVNSIVVRVGIGINCKVKNVKPEGMSWYLGETQN